MERKITRFLKTWKDSPYRKPLILQGARQVGKTYSILEFARTAYENVAYFNFETDPKLSQTFEENISPSYLIPILSHIAGVSIVREKTLIVFDEVQLCERALTSLKYFCEEAPDYHIIVAGSLLGVAVNRAQFSFPVGKVDIKTMYPMDVEDSYWPLERKRWWSGSNNASRRTAPCLLPCMRRRCSVTGSILWSAGCRSA
ncbi:MAG: AAA family ATPase [Dysosmobacter sp.]